MKIKLSRLLVFAGGMLLLLTVMGPKVTSTMAHVDEFTPYDKETLSRAGGNPLCDVAVTLTDNVDETLDINMSLNLVLICGKGGEPDVVDTVKGTGSYTLGDSAATEGRLRVMGGHYTDSLDDPRRVIDVHVVSGGLKGTVYNLYLSTISGCNIHGRYGVNGSDDLNSLSGITDCINANCAV